MARKTYSEVRSLAAKYAKENPLQYVLIYKNVGGDYTHRPLSPGISVSYTEIKALVRYQLNEFQVIVSRETIGKILEEKSINLIYCKFA